MAIVNSDTGDLIFAIEFHKNRSSALPICMTMTDQNINYYNLEELDNIIRAMVEFRVAYDEKECRDIAEEIKDQEWDEEDQAYEAERIARGREAELEAILREDELREWERRREENEAAGIRNRNEYI